MAKEIKTRQTNQGIKVLDKAKTGMRYVKNVSMKTKDKRNYLQNSEQDNAQEYAGNRASNAARNVSRKASYQTGRAVKKGKKIIKNRDRKANEKIQNAMGIVAQNTTKAKQFIHRGGVVSKQTVKRVAVAVVSAFKGNLTSAKGLKALLASGGAIAILILIIVVLFGGALSVVGGDNSTSVLSVSADVEIHETLIRQYATQYGISEYVELIKAIMMQESGGKGLDPMQSSESAFNTKYPNGITDPEYSISCGVQEIKVCLVSAEVENPVDMDNIKLALQGYNFGNGYISWAKQNYGGYTMMNAAEFSDMMATQLGWTSYGDKQYVSHVLQYYPFGKIPTGTGSNLIVQVALTQEGNEGGQPYWSWYGFDNRVEWCACFVSWCADQCGYIDAGLIPKFSLCSDGVKWFSDRGQFQDGSYVPAAGDIIFFDWGANGDVNHVGIVENVNNGVVYTIEGNSGDKCQRRSYAIGDGEIYGYGVPGY